MLLLMELLALLLLVTLQLFHLLALLRGLPSCGDCSGECSATGFCAGRSFSAAAAAAARLASAAAGERTGHGGIAGVGRILLHIHGLEYLSTTSSTSVLNHSLCREIWRVL